MVKYRHAITYHSTEENTDAFEQRQGRKEERERVLVPCDLYDDDDNEAIFLPEKEVQRVVVIFVDAAAYAPVPANRDGNGIQLMTILMIMIPLHPNLH